MADDRMSGQQALLRFVQRHAKVSAADGARFAQLASQLDLSLQEVLEREGVVGERDLAVLLSNHLRLKLLDLASFPLDATVARHLREALASKYQVVPVRVDEGVIEVAMANPLDMEALKAVEFATGRRALASVATRLEVRDALAHAYRLQESLEEFLQGVPEDESFTRMQLQDEGLDLRTIAADAELPPVVKLADLILIEGIKQGASDLHIEPGRDSVGVRYRIDGMLEDAFRFPKWVQNALTGRFKIMARLDITERRVPQDGRIQIRFQERLIDIRVSSLPIQHGEKITMRLLDSERNVLPLHRLGFPPAAMQRMREAGRRPQGLILVTGPTGSGKSTTLHSLLKEMFRPSINIITIENPIEYHLKGVNQVDINGKQGLTFASVLRSVLRQDPDVILVGEIRDQETALIACQAAQTGHLVLSTVHTNDPAATITRLLDLGIEPYTLAASLVLVVAQRLVRQVCGSCAAPYEPTTESAVLLNLTPGAQQYLRGKGCKACRNCGYAGRLAVSEMMPITLGLAKLIESRATESVIRAHARNEGGQTIFDDAIEKLRAGLTTDEEVLRVVQVDAQHARRCVGCEREVADDFTVCPHCGTVLQARCAGCQKPMDASWVSCPYCGGTATVAPAAMPSPDSAPSSPGGPFPTTLREHRALRVLIVDDQPDIRRIVRLTLEKSTLGLAVLTAQDGEEALGLIAVERPDLVIVDVSMPGIDGFEVCRRLRADVATAFVPILFLTAHDSSDFVTRSFAAGADDYITKPFRREELIARVRRMLERTYGKEATEVSGPTTSAEETSGDGWLH